MKKITRLAMVALAFVFALSFGTTAQAAAKKVSVKNKKSVTTINRGAGNKTVTLKYKVSGTPKKVTVTSSNKKVVAVQKGYTKSSAKLVAKKAGKATIIIKADKKKTTVKVTVKQMVTKVKPSVKKPVGSAAGVYTLQKGKKYSIKNSFANPKPTSKAVTYKSSKPSVAKVDKNGKITAKKPGTATITVTAKDKGKAKASFTVVVTKKIKTKTKKVAITAGATTVETGKTTTVKGTVDKKATLQKVVYSSSDEKIAAVDKLTGKVTAKKAGKVTIKASAIDGSKKSASIVITVKNPATGITFTTAPEKVYVGKTVTVKAVTNADAFDTTVTYSIDAASQKFATVDSKTGVVKGIARGTVTVTAKSVNGKTASIKLRVVEQVTKVTPKNGTATVSVAYTGKTDAIEKDIIDILKKSGLKAGTTKAVKVNGKDHTATYTGDTLTFENGKTLEDIREGKATVEFAVTTKVVTFVKQLQVAQFTNKSYRYTITIGNHTLSDVTLANPYITVVDNGTTRKVYAENGSLYFVGHVKKDIQDLTNALSADVVETEN